MTKASKTINLKKTENVKINTKFKYYNSIKIVLKTTQVFIITISHAWSAIFIYFFFYTKFLAMHSGITYSVKDGFDASCIFG